MKTDELICRINSLNSVLSEKQKAFESIKAGNVYFCKIPDVVVMKRVLEVADDFKIKVEYIEIEQPSKISNTRWSSLYDLKLDYFDNIIVDGDILVKSELGIQKLNNIFNKVKESILAHNSLLSTAYTAMELEDTIATLEINSTLKI